MCTTGIGLGLIKEGISDLITVVKSVISGSFSWGAWAMQKAISVSVSILSAGWSSLKESCRVVKDCCKNLLVSSTKVSIKESMGQATKVLATELHKGVAGEVLNQADQWCANKISLENIEDEIRKKVEEKLTRAFEKNDLIKKGLDLDTKHGNTHWQKIFIQEGYKLLADKAPLSRCLYMLKEIAMGVANNKIEYFNECLKITGVGKMLSELVSYTKNFIELFNTAVSNYTTDIESDRQVNNLEEETHSTEITAAPDIDLEEYNIVIDRLEASTDYSSKQVPR